MTNDDARIQSQQTKIIIGAIDNYLYWRDNKSTSDLRGYVLGFLTRLRHFTNFGKQRANNFKHKLNSQSNADPIELLQKHLSADSRLHNHSLDTFILESIFNNKNLFLQWFPKNSKLQSLTVLDEENRNTLYDLIKQSNINSEYYAVIAKLYEDTVTIPNHVQIACNYYALGLKKENAASFSALTRLAKSISSVVQSEIKYILNSESTTVKELISIAGMYEKGLDGINPDLSKALEFYQKASERGDASAALLAAQILQLPHNGAFKIDKTKAFQAYLRAARLGHPDALPPLERLGEEVSSKNQQELSNLYGTFFKNSEKAAYWQAQANQTESFTFN